MVEMGTYTRVALLKRGILLFWSLWISVVVLMNIGDALKVIGALPPDWVLASGNYEAIVKVTAVYSLPRRLDFLLLLGVIGWEGGCMLLFWWAFRRYRRGHPRRWPVVNLAFTALLALFGSFILVDELAHKYKMEGDHRGIAVLLLATLLALHLLPDRVEAR